MKKLWKILIILGAIIIIFLLINSLFFTKKSSISGNPIKEHYSWTKAICNETNYCQDYEIICEGENLLNMSPITGANIQHDQDWKDPRGNETIDNICNLI